MSKVLVSGRSIAVLRIMMSGIFLVAGLNHIFMPTGVTRRLTASTMYLYFPSFINPEWLVIATGVLLFAGGLLVLINRYTRYAAMVLLALLFVITISVQLQGLETTGPLFKNIAIAGALLFFITNQVEKSKMTNYEK